MTINGAHAPLLLKNARVVDPASGLDERGGMLIVDGRISGAGKGVDDGPAGTKIVDCAGRIVAPGLVDMRVFVGEPGAEHRETLASASLAAAAGGVTTMIVMPDTDPVIDDIALVDFLLRRARDTASVRIHPMAAITRGLKGEEMTEFGLMLEAGAVAFTDGRHSVKNAQVMRQALTYARNFDGLVVHHAEDRDLAGQGVMNESETATRLGLPGIPREAESVVVARDMRLARLTGARYHAAQLSCADSLAAVRRAKEDGLPVTCGVSINHLTLNELDIGSYRTFFKLSPPLRSEDDRLAMVAGLADRSIDVIVSAHDPQHVETKRHPFAEAADGAIGLETLLAAALRLVHNGDADLATVLRALSTRPAEILGLEAGTLAKGAPGDVVVFDAEAPWVCEEAHIVSRSKNTPFEGARFMGRVTRTVIAGHTVYDYASVEV
ncbi:MAG: dihydroorotase [Hyphomicrobiales bacterium]|nr:dihydroorotase [Hyphomicrobiales bacterium]